MQNNNNTIETLLKSNTKDIDKKHILLTCNKTVPSNILDQIESGLTIENLESITKNFDVFKYNTQITIHGIFDVLSETRLYGYKYLHQNKNKSIGVKYGCIDECKRLHLKQYLNLINFSYYKDSTNQYFGRSLKFTEENVNELKTIYNKINDNLFIGSKHLYKYNVWGVWYVAISININAIYEKNIKLFLDGLDITESMLIEYKDKQRLESEARDKIRRDKDALETVYYNNAKELIKNDIEFLNSNYKKSRYKEAGLYIETSYNYPTNDKYEPIQGTCKFIATFVYLPKGKRVLRQSSKKFNTLQEALNYKNTFVESSLDDKFYNISGWQIKDNKVIETLKDAITINSTPIKKELQQNNITNDIKIVDYSDKSFAVVGKDTIKIKDRLKSNGGKFNPYLKCGAGWIFSISNKTKIEKLITF